MEYIIGGVVGFVIGIVGTFGVMLYYDKKGERDGFRFP